MTPGHAANRDLAERRVVAIALDDLAELMIVPLLGERGPRGDDVAPRDERLPGGADIESSCVQRLDVRDASRLEHGAAGMVPPLRSSMVTPAVAKNVRPLPSSQNRRGRNTPR